MKSFNENMGMLYVDYFNQHGEKQTLDFVFTTKVSLSVLNSLYLTFIKEGTTDMSKIPQEKKEKYWNIACKYFEEMGDRLKASKAAYVLELITSTF